MGVDEQEVTRTFSSGLENCGCTEVCTSWRGLFFWRIFEGEINPFASNSRRLASLSRFLLSHRAASSIRRASSIRWASSSFS
jgi:hypothetical protein